MLLLAWVIGGCSNGQVVADAGPDASVIPLPSPGLSPASACLQIANAVAQREVSCQRLAASDEAAYVSAHCPADWYAQEMADYDAGRLAYDSTAVSCAVSFQQQLPCNFPPGTNSQCPALGWGLAQSGQSCGSVYACQPGLFCQFVGSSPCGTCQPASPIGGPCGGSAEGATCLEGQCNGESCAMVVGIGGDCQYGSSVCEVGLSCQGVCDQPGPVGTGCSIDSDCLDGLTCPQSGQPTCVARVGLGGDCENLSCQFGLGCAWMVDGGTACQTLTAGGACVDDLDGGLCLEAQHCLDGGSCAPLGIAGSSCGQNADCAVGQCVSGSCTLVAAGTPCGRDEDCAGGRCDFSSVAPTCVASCMTP